MGRNVSLYLTPSNYFEKDNLPINVQQLIQSFPTIPLGGILISPQKNNIIEDCDSF